MKLFGKDGNENVCKLLYFLHISFIESNNEMPWLMLLNAIAPVIEGI